MRRPWHSILLVACLSLVALQLSGLHMHVDDHGYVGIPQGTHVHAQTRSADGGHDHGSVAPGDVTGAPQPHGHSHEYDGDRDVSVVELGAGASKVLAAVVWFLLIFLLSLASGQRKWANHATARPIARRIHWRPPLRAPPALSQP